MSEQDPEQHSKAAARATGRVWLFAFLGTLGFIGALAYGVLLWGGAQDWESTALRAGAQYCDRQLDNVRGAGSYRSDPICQCTGLRTASERPLVFRYVSVRAMSAAARALAEPEYEHCVAEALAN